jgi:RNA polymerase sigma-70 factor (ECF subfamily)
MNAQACLLAGEMTHEGTEIARALRTRDPEWLDRLIERFQYRLFRYLLMLTGRRSTAEDLFQQTWLRVLERGHQYDGRWKFESWLFTIARHLVIDLSRHKRMSSLEALDEAAAGPPPPLQPAAPGPSPLDLLQKDEETARIAAALLRLPAVYREVLLLRFQEELALEDIARVLRAPLSTVKSRLYRGLEALRELFEEAK